MVQSANVCKPSSLNSLLSLQKSLQDTRFLSKLSTSSPVQRRFTRSVLAIQAPWSIDVVSHEGLLQKTSPCSVHLVGGPFYKFSITNVNVVYLDLWETRHVSNHISCGPQAHIITPKPQTWLDFPLRVPCKLQHLNLMPGLQGWCSSTTCSAFFICFPLLFCCESCTKLMSVG